MARRVLIVDDDELVLIALRELLRSEKYEVQTFSRGSAALEKLDQEDFDLLILDIVMPEMDGFELCTLIRKNDRYRDKADLVFDRQKPGRGHKTRAGGGSQSFFIQADITA